MPYMPLDVIRLFDSDFYALSSGDEFKAGLSLWCKAFLQTPAGSLPDDDRVLAHLSGARTTWKRVRDMAMRGWIKCSDGRLYHPIVARKALEAWEHRLARQARTDAARRAKEQKAQGLTGDVTDGPPQPVTTSVTESVTGSLRSTREKEGNKKEREDPSLRSGAIELFPGPDERPPRSSGTKPLRRIPADWKPTEADIAAARDLGVDWRVEAPKFHDYHLNRGKPGADWSAAWRLWCRNAVKFAQGNGYGVAVPARALDPNESEIPW